MRSAAIEHMWFRRPWGIATGALALAICTLALLGVARADTPPNLKGLWLTTDFPSLSASAGETATVKLKLQNYNLPPERIALKLKGVPHGWKAAILGGGVPIAASMPSTNEAVPLQLRVDIPASVTSGTYPIVLSAQGSSINAELPIDIQISKNLPPNLSIKSKLPSLRGSAQSSFEFEFTVQNASGKDLLVKLSAQAPAGFQTSFTENFGSQEISSIPIEAGQNKDLKVKVQAPDNAAANEYPVKVTASAEGVQASTTMTVQISGQPKVRLAGTEGRLSGEAEAGKATPISLVLTNEGSAPANNIELSASPPGEWKVEMQPRTIATLAPNEKREVQAIFTPSAKAVVGDYMVTLRANSSGGNSSSADFRVTVTTSTLWGIVGVIIIAIALLVAVGAVARFGRR